MRRLASAFVAAAILTSWGSVGANAQLSIDDIEAALAEDNTQLDRVDALLASEDTNKRITAMELLLDSGNALFIKRAKYVGLLSSDPDMRLAALKATLDAGGGWRIELDLSGVKGEDADRWVNSVTSYTGTIDPSGKHATLLYDLQPFDEDQNCYPYYSSWCGFRLTGTKLAIDMANAPFIGIVELDTEGRLVGQISIKGNEIQSVPVVIPLID